MQCEISVEEIENNQYISRTQEPDTSLKFWKFENAIIKDENGTEFRFGYLYKDKKCIIVFIRHFLCHMYKEYVDDASIIPPSYLQEAGVQLVLIGCGPSKFIKPFREATNYLGPLYVDENRDIYNAIGLNATKKPFSRRITNSPHVKSGVVRGVLSSTWRGMKYKERQGDLEQQGGALVIGPGPVVHYLHADSTPMDHALLNDLLICAGVQPVNFPNDTRVFTV